MGEPINHPPFSFRDTALGPWRGMGQGYRCVAANLVGFVQQVAVSYVKNGYWFYVAGAIPEGKPPERIDSKFIGLYQLCISKYVRSRRRRHGAAAVQYIRLGRFFLVLATHGEHLFFARERKVIRDVRRTPIRVGGYAIGFRNGRVSVRIERAEFRMLKNAFSEHALAKESRLTHAFSSLAFEPYAPIRSQLLTLLRLVNRKRAIAGLPAISKACIRFKRRIVRPFLGG